MKKFVLLKIDRNKKQTSNNNNNNKTVDINHLFKRKITENHAPFLNKTPSKEIREDLDLKICLKNGQRGKLCYPLKASQINKIHD